jgi:predicted PurR-regulated permease PerM
VILAVTAGGTLYGIVGAFLAVPVLSVAAVTVRYARQHLAEVEPAPPDSPPAAAGQPNPEVVHT